MLPGNGLTLTHERAIHVFGFLADFAQAYPTLSENEYAMYRDLCKAAMLTQEREDWSLRGSIDLVIARSAALQAKADVGAFILAAMRSQGLRVSVAEDRLLVGPPERVTEEVGKLVKRHRDALREAVRNEVPV